VDDRSTVLQYTPAVIRTCQFR